MIDEKTKRNVAQFCDAWQGLKIIYEDYARTCGISYTSLYILNVIVKLENCTQKKICEITLLPKQTVNNVITSFYKNGYIELCELPENRKIKIIHLTEAGKKYADTLITHIKNAEYKAMAKLTAKEQEQFNQFMQIYCDAFRAEMM